LSIFFFFSPIHFFCVWRSLSCNPFKQLPPPLLMGQIQSYTCVFSRWRRLTFPLSGMCWYSVSRPLPDGVFSGHFLCDGGRENFLYSSGVFSWSIEGFLLKSGYLVFEMTFFFYFSVMVYRYFALHWVLVMDNGKTFPLYAF